jgi:FkbM family methyltransferase
MIGYFKRKLEKWKTKRTFREYGHQVETYDLPKDGKIDFAVWLNPLEKPKKITQGGVDFFRKFIKEGDLAVDIGTHMGDTTVPMALAAGKKGLVLGFDPNPHVFKIFTVNASLNKDKVNIKPLPYAITHEDGEFYFTSSEASFNNGGIETTETNRHGNFTLKQKVKGIKLEKYLKENLNDKLSSLSFIKVDTEGYDKTVLESITGLLESQKPTIVAECFGKLTKEERGDLFDLLHSRGYILHHFDDFDASTKFILIEDREGMNRWKHFDIAAVHKSRIGSMKL